jgi:DNA-binding transcriptional LysR family regulator
VQRLIGEVNEAYALARCISEGKRGKLRVGFHLSMLYQGLGDMIAAMEHDEPLLEIELLEMPTQDQVQSLLAGRIDVGFGHSTIVPETLSSITILHEPLVVCVPRDHWVLNADRFSLNMLQDEGFICFMREASPTYFDRIVSLCVEAGFTPRIRHQVRQWTTVVAMVSKGMGIAIAPQCLAQSGMEAEFIPLGSQPFSELQCIWQETSEQPLVTTLVKYARKFLSATEIVQGA